MIDLRGVFNFPLLYIVSHKTVQYVDGLTGRLGVGIPPVLDTDSSSCSHNFKPDRLVLSIVYDILAAHHKVVEA